MRAYSLTAQAAQDLQAIWDYIATDNLSAADRMIAEIGKALQGLAGRPGKGHVRQDLTQRPVRFWGVRSYLIVYRSDVEPLQILRVIHGARDLVSLL